MTLSYLFKERKTVGKKKIIIIEYYYLVFVFIVKVSGKIGTLAFKGNKKLQRTNYTRTGIYFYNSSVL